MGAHCDVFLHNALSPVALQLLVAIPLLQEKLPARISRDSLANLQPLVLSTISLPTLASAERYRCDVYYIYRERERERDTYILLPQSMTGKQTRLLYNSKPVQVQLVDEHSICSKNKCARVKMQKNRLYRHHEP